MYIIFYVCISSNYNRERDRDRERARERGMLLSPDTAHWISSVVFSTDLITVGSVHFTSLTLQGPRWAGSAQMGEDSDIRAGPLCG